MVDGGGGGWWSLLVVVVALKGIEMLVDEVQHMAMEVDQVFDQAARLSNQADHQQQQQQQQQPGHQQYHHRRQDSTLELSSVAASRAVPRMEPDWPWPCWDRRLSASGVAWCCIFRSDGASSAL